MNGFQCSCSVHYGPKLSSAAADPSGTQLVLLIHGPLMVGVSQAAYEDYKLTERTQLLMLRHGYQQSGVAGSETKMTTIRGSYDMGMAMIKVCSLDH